MSGLILKDTHKLTPWVLFEVKIQTKENILIKDLQLKI